MPFPDDDKKTTVLVDVDTEPDLDQPWAVIVYDDPVNLMHYVSMVFRRVFGYTREKADQHMMEVHEQGKSVLWTGQRERAEFYVQQLQEYQLLASLKKAV